MAKTTALVPTERIERAILFLRDEKILLDKDLAELYGVSTGNLNKAVTRNLDRFPPDFMFQLTKEELANLKFRFGTSRWGGTRKQPRAFTEQGAAVRALLSSRHASSRPGAAHLIQSQVRILPPEP